MTVIITPCFLNLNLWFRKFHYHNNHFPTVLKLIDTLHFLNNLNFQKQNINLTISLLFQISNLFPNPYINFTVSYLRPLCFCLKICQLSHSAKPLLVSKPVIWLCYTITCFAYKWRPITFRNPLIQTSLKWLPTKAKQKSFE